MCMGGLVYLVFGRGHLEAIGVLLGAYLKVVRAWSYGRLVMPMIEAKTIVTVVFIWGICCQYWWREILEVLIIESIVRQSKIPPSIWCSWFTAMVMMRRAMVIRCSSLYCQRSWINAIATWTWLNIITAYHNTYSTLSFEYHYHYLYIIIHIPPYIE